MVHQVKQCEKRKGIFFSRLIYTFKKGWGHTAKFSFFLFFLFLICKQLKKETNTQ
jgi:hypothetical protein